MKLNVEQKIHLDKFQLRPYQIPIWDAVENKGYRKVFTVLPRRAGKDLCVWNLAIRYALRKPCLVLYCLPTDRQARRVIFDGITIHGDSFLSYIPKELITKTNIQEMKIILKNGSIIQCTGGDNFKENLVGTNPSFIVFSEYARFSSAEAYEFARPILAANDGVFIALTTPYGKNHAYHMYKVAKDLPDWFVYVKTTDDTNHIDYDVLQQERSQMSNDLFLQEYYCSFDRGVSGAYYGADLNRIRDIGQITSVPWEPGLLVHCAIDIGVADSSTIIWFQTTGDGQVIRIIDCYSFNNLGLDHLVHKIQERRDQGWIMGKYIAPHDLMVREWGGGAITRYEKARQLGINFTILPQTSIEDGIDNVRSLFSKFWIDSVKCKSLIDALENYYREWDEERQVYKPKPVRNWATHYADALRYLCDGLHKTKKGLSSEEFDRQKAQAMLGNDPQLPRQFRNDPRYNWHR